MSSASTISVSSYASANYGIPQRALSCSNIEAAMKWKPIANGAWAQIHLFLEMDSDTASTTKKTATTKSKGMLKNFRIVAWILDTGEVIVNDSLQKGCKWEHVDRRFRKFTSLEGQIYGFSFRNALQAVECSHFVNQILSNVKGNGRRGAFRSDWDHSCTALGCVLCC